MADETSPPSVDTALQHLHAAFEAQLERFADELRRALAAQRDDLTRELQRAAEVQTTHAVDAAIAKAQAEADQAVAHVRAEAEQELNQARADAEQTLAHMRAQANETLAQTRAQAEQTLASQVAAARSEGVARAKEELAALATRLQRHIGESAAAGAIDDVLQGMRRLDAAASLTQVLDALVEVDLPTVRIGVFVVSGPTLKGWRGRGFTGPDAVDVRQVTAVLSAQRGLLARAVTSGETTHTRGEAGEPEVEFVPLQRGTSAIAVPIRVGGRAVGALYADNAAGGTEAPRESEGGSGASQSWANVVEILGRHAGRCLEALTAARSSQVQAHLGSDRARR